MPKAQWREATLSPLDIALDRQNPRIVVTDSDKESDIILSLLRYEDIIDLARKIAKTGLLAGERVIVTKENNQFVVLEGNRRVCACKLLLSPQLIPAEYKNDFPKLTTATEIDRIKKIKVDVAPDRKSAEHILTLRHTEPGIRRWKPIARMRRVMRLLNEGFTIEQVAEEHNATEPNIRKTVREYRLLQFAQQLKGLTKKERYALINPDLVTNPYTRFFELAGVREFLGLSFTTNGVPSIAISRKKFDERLKTIVRAFLTGDDETYNTRTTPEDLFGSVFRQFLTKLRREKDKRKRDKERKQNKKHQQAETGDDKEKTRSERQDQQAESKRDKFFESLRCRVQNNALISVVGEIRKVNPDLFAISGTYLLRTLMELCLRHLIKQAGKRIPSKSDPTLTELLNFALQNRDIFPTPRLADVLEAARSHKAIDYLNIVVHQKYMDADPTTLKSVANQLRSFISHVLEETT